MTNKAIIEPTARLSETRGRFARPLDLTGEGFGESVPPVSLASLALPFSFCFLTISLCFFFSCCFLACKFQLANSVAFIGSIDNSSIYQAEQIPF